MATTRLIIKQTVQPPIDTPASIKWLTVDIENEALFDMLRGRGNPHERYSTFEVVGAELVEPRFPRESSWEIAKQVASRLLDKIVRATLPADVDREAIAARDIAELIDEIRAERR